MTNKEKLKNIKLYGITTEPMDGYTYESMVEAACLGGVDILQYRDESRRSDQDKLTLIHKIRKITRKFDVIFIINNRLDLAILGEADGVHLGQNDLPIKEVAKLINKKMIIGKSTHSLDQAIEAETLGADYIGIGPLVQTPTKPTYLPIGMQLAYKVQNTVKIPAVAIGGINQNNIDSLTGLGLKRLAIVRAIFAVENIEKAAKLFKEKLL
ncbi:MAG: thiamine phosphate synthase [bacterium]|nr:thiamine phosphate synthase [bacterium]